MKRLLPAVTFTLLFSSQCCFAQSKTAFDGFYSGVSLGYNQTSVSEGSPTLYYTLDNTNYPGNYIAGNGQSSQSSGLIGGINFGYDHRLDSFVTGIEFSASLPGGTANGLAAKDDLFTPTSNKPISSTTKIQSLYTLKPKLGFVLDKDTMIYGLVGVAMGSIKRTITDVGYYWFTPSSKTVSSNVNQFGYVLGAGVETMLSEQISFKLEFNYVDLGNPSFSYTSRYGGAPVPVTQSIKINNIATTAGLSYRF